LVDCKIEVNNNGKLSLGEVRQTKATGYFAFDYIFHANINNNHYLGSIRKCIVSSLKLCEKLKISSISIPLLSFDDQR